MRKQIIEHHSLIDALITVTKRLSAFEEQYSMRSEEFYRKYEQGLLSDDASLIEWANDYRHYLAIRADLERQLQHVA